MNMKLKFYTDAWTSRKPALSFFRISDLGQILDMKINQKLLFLIITTIINESNIFAFREVRPKPIDLNLEVAFLVVVVIE